MLNRFIFFAAMMLAMSACGKDDPPPTEEPPPGPADITDEIITENLNFPWEIVWGPDNYIWMTEKGGKISRVNPANGEVMELISIADVVSRGEGGLLGMALHPDFSNTPHVFVAYCYDKNNSYTEKIVRYNYNGTTLTDPAILIDDIEAANIHDGCRLVIKGDKLFITTGDASEGPLAQNLSSKNGKVLRVNLDGSIPSDNPDPMNAVWSFGHRNAQGLVFVGDSLYSSEHGPANDDEINIIHRGANYGWPEVEGECDSDEQAFCEANDVVEPIMKWTPTIAVSGTDFYSSDSIPQWKNSLLVCTLKASRLMQLKLDGSQITETNAYFEGKYGRLRDVCVSPDGKVYICTSNGNNDKIIRIEY
jgi:glucose/arabinose dehydrogenase